MEEEQEQLLEEGKRQVKEQAFYMKQAIENAKLRDVLKHASNMLAELKAEKLSPKNYYILFMQVFDELRALEAGIKEEYKRGRKMADLYENVQHAGGLIPRLYLLITVGSIYISTHEVPAKDILNDLMEMMKGVQHPIKGLFLRYYFLKLCKDRLPDKGSEYEGEGGDFNVAINVIITNLAEMNKLWIKVQTTPGKEKSKREKERNDLKVTIGENLVRLSQLEGCTKTVYKEFVLDKLIEIITSKDDKISQQYLMDCIIQAFPDIYHINTLEKLLQTCALIMQNNVDIKTIFIRLMDRLADFASNPPDPEEEEEAAALRTNLDLFAMFKNNIDSIIENQGATVELRKLLELQVAFLKFSIQCYPGNIEYVNEILKSCCTLCQKQATSDLDEDSLKNIVKLLTLLLESLSISVLQMDEFPKLMKYLPLSKRRIVALKICQTVTSSALPLTDQKIIGQIVDFLDPILKDSKEISDIDPSEFEEEQHLVARLPHLVHHENPDFIYQMLESFKVQFLKGGAKRQFYTLPSIFFAYVKLARYINECHKRINEPEPVEEPKEVAEGEENEEGEGEQPAEEPLKIYNIKRKFFKGEFELNFKKLYETLQEIVAKLANDYPELTMKLYLEFIQIINECDVNKELDEQTYDLFTQVLEIYQNDVADAEEKIAAIAFISSALCQITCLSEENFDGLASNTASYSSKLLRKYDQCLAVLDSTHLFYCHAQRNEHRVMECFKKALKSTEAIFNAHPNEKNFTLYVAILNKFLYYFGKDEFQAIGSDDVQKCMEAVKGKLEKLNEKDDSYLRNTLAYIEFKKAENAKFQSLNW